MNNIFQKSAIIAELEFQFNSDTQNVWYQFLHNNHLIIVSSVWFVGKNFKISDTI